MNWKYLLATLRTQTPHLTVEYFLKSSCEDYFINYPEKFFFELPHCPLKDYIRENPFWFRQGIEFLQWIEKNKVQIICYGEENYPKEFYLLNDPPIMLTYWGKPCWQDSDLLSVVGSRHPSMKSLEWMDQHLTPLVQNGICLVSGAARGIDQKAHSISLRNKGRTIAFLPSGLNEIYPKEFSDWTDRILEFGGDIVSEYSHLQTMRKHHFLERNRMIARLGKCLLVVEARQRSGSSMTARLAIENNQSVCVLPAFPSDINFQGSVDLLFNGAFPIRDSVDLRMLMEMSSTLNVPNLF